MAWRVVLCLSWFVGCVLSSLGCPFIEGLCQGLELKHLDRLGLAQTRWMPPLSGASGACVAVAFCLCRCRASGTLCLRRTSRLVSINQVESSRPVILWFLNGTTMAPAIWKRRLLALLHATKARTTLNQFTGSNTPNLFGFNPV